MARAVTLVTAVSARGLIGLAAPLRFDHLFWRPWLHAHVHFALTASHSYWHVAARTSQSHIVAIGLACGDKACFRRGERGGDTRGDTHCRGTLEPLTPLRCQWDRATSRFDRQLAMSHTTVERLTGRGSTLRGRHVIFHCQAMHIRFNDHEGIDRLCSFGI